MTRVAVESNMLNWAIERASANYEELALRFPKLPEWDSGDVNPTLKQLEKFAKALHVPIGYLFLPEPPQEHLPIPDFRTFDGEKLTRPSPNLMDIIYSCQERQSWFREFSQITRQEPHDFVGSLTIQVSAEDAANNIRETIAFDLNARQECNSWEDALRMFIAHADAVGILVMTSGIVHSNTSRKLDPKEFRGFALSDSLAPLIFINGADTKSGQMFTLAHELAHLWLNVTGLSNAGLAPRNGFRREEVWCNAVAAELLVPLTALRPSLIADEDVIDAMRRLSRQFKVSTLVILRRLLDINWYDRNAFDRAWAMEMGRLRELASRRGSGGNFYRSTVSRASKRFTQAIITSTLEGHTLYRDAFRMLGVKKNESFNQLGREVGVIL